MNHDSVFASNRGNGPVMVIHVNSTFACASGFYRTTAPSCCGWAHFSAAMIAEAPSSGRNWMLVVDQKLDSCCDLLRGRVS